MQPLGLPAGDTANWARVVSADGNTIAGKAEPMDQAFRWRPSDGTTRLGPIVGPDYSVSNWQQPYGISADGSTIVGYAYIGGTYAAFIWDEAHGMRALQRVLFEEYGLPVQDWYIPAATAISPDGSMIGGYGYYQSQMYAWVAVVPEPTGLGFVGVAGYVLTRRSRQESA